MFTLYTASQVGNPSNCYYPNACTVHDLKSLEVAVSFDYVTARYQNAYRSKENFLVSDCLAADCDNDHSENPSFWVTPDDIRQAFPDVAFFVHYSRHHLVSKHGKAARPKFHVFFPIEPVTSANEYTGLKQHISQIFPYFDTNALDAARFFFGTPKPQVDYFAGELNLTEFLRLEQRFLDLPMPGDAPIKEGSRNATMSKLAGKILVRLGDTEEARRQFLDRSKLCVPPLDDRELSQIWYSALKFYARVKESPSYVAPDEYASKEVLFPDELTDTGQATVLSRVFSKTLRHSGATGWLSYEDGKWEMSDSIARLSVHSLTNQQLKLARTELAKSELSDEKASYLKSFKAFALKHQESRRISGCLKEAAPLLRMDPAALDADPFLLNTPSGTVDLRTGKMRPHEPSDMLTKMTSVSPSNQGETLWQETLERTFCGDKELIAYVQKVAGLAAIGKVMEEALIIAYGNGANGKSTFWNALQQVLGSYSGSVSPDAFLTANKGNYKNEFAELRGKRLVIAGETEEGTRLSTAAVKRITSTDLIVAEKKYRDPFSFKPSHTLIFYTNHLPRVSASDQGTWRRLIVVPFEAEFKREEQVKNFAEELFEKAGGAILRWVIDGALQIHKDGYRLELPACVKEATAEYRESNDWLSHFIQENCDVDEASEVQSRELYLRYRAWASTSGEYVRSNKDFSESLLRAGFQKKKTKRFNVICGLLLRSEFED